MELDLIDRKLLYYYDKNVRQSIAALAKKIKIGRNVALYRINRLKERGIIRGSYVEINNSLLGYMSFRIFLKLGNYTKDDEEKLINFISARKNILWLSRVLGNWDLDVVFMTKKLGEFELFRKKLSLQFNNIIENSEISLLSKICLYPKDYLITDERKDMRPTIFSIEDETKYVPDEKDEEMLSLLTKDATLNIVDLAQRLQLSINTVKKKMRNLEKNKIILGYRLFIDPSKMGYEYHKVHLTLRYYTEKDLNSLRDWLASQSILIYTDHYMNNQDFEIELHVRSEQEGLRFIEQLYQKFGNIIKDHIYIKFYDVRVYKYIPS